MAKAPLESVVRHIRKIVDVQMLAEATDGQLVERFVRDHEESAFAVLLRRHGSMVLAVCRGVLGQREDAEDVFQATFLLLARKAGSIRKQQSVASWLHGVAYRLALRAKEQRTLRRSQEIKASTMRRTDPSVEEAWRELRPLLHEEMERLPEKYRTALVLFYLEGKTQEEVAREFGCPIGTVQSRLGRGRKLLRERLTRRGLDLSAGSFAAFLVAGMESAPVQARLLDSTLKACLQLGSAAGAVSAPVAALVEEGLKAMLSTKLKIATVLLLAVSFVAGAGALAHQVLEVKLSETQQPIGPQPAAKRPDSEIKDQARTDLYGDPLPPGAVVRLGSLQLRHYCGPTFVFSADGKTLLSAGRDRVVRYWDMGSGKLLRARTVQGAAGQGRGLNFSPDGKTVVCWDNGALHFWEVESGKEIKRLPVPGQSNYLSYLRCSPDGRTLAVGSDLHTVSLCDWKGETQRQLNLPTQGRFAGQNRDSTCHCCFSPDGKLLAIGPFSQDPLCIWDVATGNELRRIPDVRASVSAFSRDSRLLAVAHMQTGGDRDRGTALRLYEVATGKKVLDVPLPGTGFTWFIAFSPDGKVIAPVDTEAIYLLDLSSGREIRRFGGKQTERQREICFSPDGRLLAASGTNRIHLWDVASGNELCERPGNDEQAYGLAYAPDGRLLATGGWLATTISLWDTTSGRRVRQLDLERKTGYVRQLAFTTNGDAVAVGSGDGIFQLLDTTTGRVQRSVSLAEALQPKQEHVTFHAFHLTPDHRRLITLERVFIPKAGEQVGIWDTDPLKLIASHDVGQAPRNAWVGLGHQAALLTEKGIVIADGRTGRIRLGVPGSWDAPLAASPDGRLLAAGLKEQPEAKRDTAKIRVWEASSGNELITLATGPVQFLSLATDCRRLITADTQALRVWDLRTGREIHRQAFPEDFTVASDFICGLRWSPDGQRATTALTDGTLLIWEIPVLVHRPRVAALSDTKEATRWWDDLSSEDAAQAFTTVWEMIDAPEPAIAALRKHLTPAREQPSEVRESAAKELEKMGKAGAPVILRALAANPSPEMRRRLETLLSKISGDIPTVEDLRRLRAVLVLEQIATSDAKQVLQTLANGAPEARLTQEAKASLERLAKRP